MKAKITKADLPTDPGVDVVFELPLINQQLTVSIRVDGCFYGMADDFDVVGKDAAEMVKKLNNWSATVAGWENR